MHRRTVALAAAALPFAALPAIAQQRRIGIRLSHGLRGAPLAWLQQQAARFNASQDACTLTLVEKEMFARLLDRDAQLSLLPDHATPMILALDRVSLQRPAVPAFRPLHQLLAETGVAIDLEAIPPGVRGPCAEVPRPQESFHSLQRRLVAMPHTAFTAVMSVNLDALGRAGLSATAFSTWAEVRAAALRIKAAGAAPQAIAASWPAWTMFEQMAAIHDAPFATHRNGFDAEAEWLQRPDGPAPGLLLTGPFFRHHLRFLGDLQRQGLYLHQGRGAEADALFAAGRCAIAFGASADHARLRRQAPFRATSLPLPYHAELVQAPRNAHAGGSGLWLRDATADEARGAAEFCRFIASPGESRWWHATTGYAPITVAGADARGPAADAAVLQLARSEATPHSAGLRLGFMAGIREDIGQALEAVFQGRQRPDQALEQANARGSAAQQEFRRVHGRNRNGLFGWNAREEAGGPA
ncbi:extracellular solute-binding protein [Plastoroseomonas hellenica]|uniref:extracellular solute-binding protein n=1 Tax=Plastoroseomonas hellenica TaxID=2687306 RepID=UPI001BAAAF21|nr:extracellular solute-binding protein [Plastoroseomonas hellenica]MBR0644842.1 extracellular solute-binding protein [Plastoroseomonas hellenica]